MLQSDSIKNIIFLDSVKTISKKTTVKTDTFVSDSPSTIKLNQAKEVIKSNSSVLRNKQLNQKDTTPPNESIRSIDTSQSVNLDSTREIVYHNLPVNQQESRNDTVIVPDSTKNITDSITVEPTGFIGNTLPKNTYGSTWLFILFLFLLITLSMAINFRKESLLQSIKSLFRQDTETSDSFKASKLIRPRNYIVNTLFTISIWAIALNFIFNPFIEPFSIRIFLYRAGLLILFIIAKHILFEIVGRTFFGVKQVKLFKNYYFNIFFYTSIFLLPILICYAYIPEIRYIQLIWILIGILGISYISLLFKILQTFYTKKLDLFYIFLYFCTLEIIPLAILIGANNFTYF